MYDKGNNLRIEVTINNPKEFKILKTENDDDSGEVINTKWVPMGKSIANLYRYVEISKNITKRYIEALPEINIEEKVPIDNITDISKFIIVDERRYAGLNILNEDTLTLFRIIANGKYLINGFTNKMIRKEFYECEITSKEINKMTRWLSKLKAHGIIKKVANKNKYYLTTKGRKIITSILLYTGKELLS